MTKRQARYSGHSATQAHDPHACSHARRFKTNRKVTTNNTRLGAPTLDQAKPHSTCIQRFEPDDVATYFLQVTRHFHNCSYEPNFITIMLDPDPITVLYSPHAAVSKTVKHVSDSLLSQGLVDPRSVSAKTNFNTQNSDSTSAGDINIFVGCRDIE